MNRSDAASCAQCGGPIRARPTGRPATYCSTPCRQAASRKRRAAEAARSRLAELDDRVETGYQHVLARVAALVDAANFDSGPDAATLDRAALSARAALHDLEAATRQLLRARHATERHEAAGADGVSSRRPDTREP